MRLGYDQRGVDRDVGEDGGVGDEAAHLSRTFGVVGWVAQVMGTDRAQCENLYIERHVPRRHPIAVNNLSNRFSCVLFRQQATESTAFTHRDNAGFGIPVTVGEHPFLEGSVVT